MDGLEADLQGQARVIRLDFLSEVGRAAARNYAVHIIPVILVFDGQGQLVLRQTGVDAAAIKAKIAEYRPVESG